ncbi:MAG: hypothetical protein ABSG64_04475 [Solirubrobacteraceae bacterium]
MFHAISCARDVLSQSDMPTSAFADAATAARIFATELNDSKVSLSPAYKHMAANLRVARSFSTPIAPSPVSLVVTAAQSWKLTASANRTSKPRVALEAPQAPSKSPTTQAAKKAPLRRIA